jgi:hypothetical protein
MGIKIWLDDVRPEPAGWVRAYTVEEVRKYLNTEAVDDLSIDNDLGLKSAVVGDYCGHCEDEIWDGEDYVMGCVTLDPNGDCLCPCHTEMNPEGYTLVDWMESSGTWPKNKPTVHSQNAVRAAYMRKVINKHYNGE